MSIRPARWAATVTASVLAIGTLSASPVHASTDPLDVRTGRASRSALADFEVRLMSRINDVRARSGLPRITRVDPCVDAMAESWSERIATTGVLAHRDQRQVLRRCDQAWAGENLVRGDRLSPRVVVDAWLASPSHREILMKRRARRAGVAVTVDGSGRYVGVLNVTDPG